ncbi:uncharacterized protein [Rutidosis leptorrhynchoides]|uniref:uncharacterized protein n=1 Tax=Rutidosis leptorrhynchoides TaxID=125765 RepID=UPI003A9A412F
MEGVHAAISDALDAALYFVILVGSHLNQVKISICIYVDDVLFVGEWNYSNACNLLSILTFFYAVSGLKINLLISSLFGVGGPLRMANIMGCSASSTPFTFLGIPICKNMNHLESWTPIIDKVRICLSSWKVNLLFIDIRLTLVKSVLGSIGTYHMFMFKSPTQVIKKMESLRVFFLLGR